MTRFTILICTRDRATSLARTLDAVQVLDYSEDYEVIVVDNGSVDDTRDVVHRAAARSRVLVRYFREDRPGKSAALNTGIGESRGSIIVFTDDDALPERDWLREYDVAFRTYTCDWSFGRVVPAWEAGEPAWFSPELNGLFALLDFGSEPFRVTNPAQQFYGVNCAVRRDAFVTLGAYRDDLGPTTSKGGGGEDTEMFRRALSTGQTIMYLPSAVVAHCIPAERADRGFQRRRMWQARQQNYLLTSTSRLDVPHVLGIPRFQYRLALRDLVSMTRACIRRNAGVAFSHELRLIRFVLLLQQAIFTRARTSSTGLEKNQTAAASHTPEAGKQR